MKKTEKEIEELFINKIMEYITEEDRRHQLHLTDLISPCVRKVWFEKNDPLPELPDEAMRLGRGKKMHEIQLTNNHELKLEYDGVMTSIDEYEDGILIEKKTANFIPLDLAEVQKYYQYYIDQANLEALFLMRNSYFVEQVFLLFIKDGPQRDPDRPPLKAIDITSLINIEEAERKFKATKNYLAAILEKPNAPDVPALNKPDAYPCVFYRYDKQSRQYLMKHCKYYSRCWA